jgi:hypothetical protein
MLYIQPTNTYEVCVPSITNKSDYSLQRYRPRNLLLYGIPPGPTEFNADQLQGFMINLIDDLINLYENGILVKTPSYPQGTLML